MPLTHYKASWTKVGEYQGPVTYPGIVVADKDLEGLPEDLIGAIGGKGEYNKQILEKLLSKPLSLRDKTGLDLYCGEWGCLPTVPRQARLQWYRDHRANLEENGISWATWDYKGSFGIFDEEGNVDREFVDVLLR
jgi:endoglucanase